MGHSESVVTIMDSSDDKDNPFLTLATRFHIGGDSY